MPGALDFVPCRESPTPEPTSPKTSRTHVAKDGEQSPRLPHEHGESSDSGTGAPSDVMRQAKEDVDSGKLPTDRGEATDEADRRQKR